jgi:hypothetical protein
VTAKVVSQLVSPASDCAMVGLAVVGWCDEGGLVA